MSCPSARQPVRPHRQRIGAVDHDLAREVPQAARSRLGRRPRRRQEDRRRVARGVRRGEDPRGEIGVFGRSWVGHTVANIMTAAPLYFAQRAAEIPGGDNPQPHDRLRFWPCASDPRFMLSGCGAIGRMGRYCLSSLCPSRVREGLEDWLDDMIEIVDHPDLDPLDSGCGSITSRIRRAGRAFAGGGSGSGTPGSTPRARRCSGARGGGCQSGRGRGRRAAELPSQAACRDRPRWGEAGEVAVSTATNR